MTNTGLFALFGGMALLWYGIRLAGEGLQRAAGGRLRQILGTVSANRSAGAGAGILRTSWGRCEETKETEKLYFLRNVASAIPLSPSFLVFPHPK